MVRITYTDKELGSMSEQEFRSLKSEWIRALDAGKMSKSTYDFLIQQRDRASWEEWYMRQGR